MATKLTPVPNVGSQIERAVLAYLKDAFGDDASLYNFYFSNDWKLRVAPCIDVLATKSGEVFPHGRVESYTIVIDAKWPGNNEVGQPNPDFNWQSINDFIGVVMAAMSQSNNGQDFAYTASQITTLGRALAVSEPDVHGDMVDFTCEYVEYKGAQRAQMSEDGTFFIKEVRYFEIRAVPSNVD